MGGRGRGEREEEPRPAEPGVVDGGALAGADRRGGAGLPTSS